MKKRGFTLVELSIVLVIIGLIVGGVLVGRDLIKAAEIRSQIKQIENLETAIGAFRVKYNCLPGDCATATSFFSSSYTVVNGDGNGIISSLSGGSGGPWSPFNGNCTGPGVQDEIPQLFLHLGLANMSEFASDGNSNQAGIGYPFAKLGGSLYVSCLTGPLYGPLNTNLSTGNIILAGAKSATAGNPTDRIFYQYGGVNYTSSNCQYACGFTFNDTRIIDEKIDDGVPNKGRFGVLTDTSASTCAMPSTSSYAGTLNTGCNIAAGKKLPF